MNKNNLSAKDYSIIKSSLECVTFLKEFRLKGCRLGNKGAAVIGQALVNNGSIKCIDLSDNKIDDEGFKAFEELPIKNSTLEKLILSKNYLTVLKINEQDVSCKEFFKNISFNNCLRNLNFFDNQINNDAGILLIDSLRSNKYLKKINLKYNRIQLRILEEIARLTKENSEKNNSKYIPNLRKDIRNNFITDEDFVYTGTKINDAKVNAQNLKEKLDDDLKKFNSLMEEERAKTEDFLNSDKNLKKRVEEIELSIKEIYLTSKETEKDHLKNADTLHKEVINYVEKIRLLESIRNFIILYI